MFHRNVPSTIATGTPDVTSQVTSDVPDNPSPITLDDPTASVFNGFNNLLAPGLEALSEAAEDELDDEVATTPVVTTKKLRASEFEGTTLEDVELWPALQDESPKVLRVRGFYPKQINQECWRTICIALDIRGYKNKKKDWVFDAIAAKKKNSAAYVRMYNSETEDQVQFGSEFDDINPTVQSVSRKTKNCTFRLLNVLFSDEFVERFSHLGDQPTKDDLTAGLQAGELFWRDVCTSFVDEDRYGELLFSHPTYNESKIDPSSNVQPHDWKKCRALYKEVVSKYKVSSTNFKKSGTHESDFYKFVNGQMDVMYLHQHLLDKPNLIEFVEEALSVHVFRDSMTTSSDEAEDGTTNGVHQKRNGSSISSAIDRFSRSGEEVAIKRLRVYQQQVAVAEMHLDLKQKMHEVEIKKTGVEMKKTMVAAFMELNDRLISIRTRLKNETDTDIRNDLEFELNILMEQRSLAKFN